MKVNLIHPPHYQSSDDRLDAPLGLLYIAEHLRQNNIDVSVTDLSGVEQKNWEIPYADIYGITVYITSIDITNGIIKLCKSINPHAVIVVGGAHPTARPMEFDFVDYVVVGNGEVAMVDIAQGKKCDHIIRGETPSDSFVFPAYDLVGTESYHRIIDGKPSLPYLTSRGCPFKCVYCGLSKIHRINSMVRVAHHVLVSNQLTRIKNEFGIDRIAFQDDIFTLKGQRLSGILKTIKELGIRFRGMGRAGYDNEETYKMLADSGCEQISWGIESGSQYILDKMNKQVKVEDNYNVIKWAKKYGINSRAFFMFGFPGETPETIEETKKFIVEADPDQYFVSNFVPFPGCEIGDNPEKFGITNIVKDYSQFYQVSKDGTGGQMIDTKWLKKEELRKLELEFRGWLKGREFRGGKQKYEIELQDTKK